MGHVVFVGDKPSLKNTDPNIPFIGTMSHQNLLKWINELGVSDYTLVNSHNEDSFKVIVNCHKNGYGFVALGKNALEALNTLGIECFLLPHPSPRNRQLNNPELINKKLIDCKKYLSNESWK